MQAGKPRPCLHQGPEHAGRQVRGQELLRIDDGSCPELLHLHRPAGQEILGHENRHRTVEAHLMTSRIRG